MIVSMSQYCQLCIVTHSLILDFMINTLYLLIADMAKHLAIQIFLMMTKKMFADLIRKNYQNIHERNYYSFVQSIIAFLEY